MKRFLFRYYGAIGLLLGLFGVALALGVRDWKILVGILSAALSFIYFVQKQKLEELRLFKVLFAEFNARYDKMNKALNSIYSGSTNEPLTKEEVDQLYDYFNLCAEEYLYYRKGYIYPEVWEAWLAGMKYFYDNPRIQALWDREIASGSYYGFNFK